MVDRLYWQQKIVALLHDPPDKALKISKHEERASNLISSALIGLPDTVATGIPDAKLIDRVKYYADPVAAVSDRWSLIKNLEVLDWPKPERSLVIHPLSGQRLSLNISANIEESQDAQVNAVKLISKNTSDPQKRFLLLWRYLEEELYRLKPDLPWGSLPADTRIPNHSVLHHNRVTSALVNIERPATLIFSIGPVQGFIETARKTRDLWMGSYILSYLTWHAIKVIAEKVGPDNIIYPSLLEQPLVDLWLKSEKGLKDIEPDEKNLRLATFPNKFTAIIPANEAESLAKECENALRLEWKRLADRVWDKLRECFPEITLTSKIWDRQIRQFPEIYWAIYKWDEKPEEIARLYEELTGDNKFNKISERFKNNLNVGALYSTCHELAERALSARKATRNFEQVYEPGGKCTICGEREILHDGKGWQGKSFWQNLSSKIVGHIEQDGRERLCAICTIKRLIQPFVLKDELNLTGDFPSTDSMAVVSFVKGILERWDQAYTYVEGLVDAIKDTELKNTAFTGMDIPGLTKLAGNKGENAKDLLNLDGEWLFLESYDRQQIAQRYNIQLSEEQEANLKESLRKLYEVTGVTPRDYYAILTMDGDHMGEWLSGEHEGLVNFKDLIHPKALEQLVDKEKLLELKYPVSPSLHAAISKALANFALHCVPSVVENLHYGRLIYAGGDEVLAFIPLTEVLTAARELRALFSGEAELKENNTIEVNLGSDKWSGWIDWNGQKLLTMGNKATASIGVAVAHRLHPLRDALRQAREAEDSAKNQYGRNAICIRWLKRSGEQVQMGAKFSYTEHNIKDALKIFLEIGEMISEDKDGLRLSSRFAGSLMEEAFTLTYLSVEAQKAEILRLLRRHTEGEKETKERLLPELAEKLIKLSIALDSHITKLDPDNYSFDKPQRGLIELAKWVTFLRFLAGGE